MEMNRLKKECKQMLKWMVEIAPGFAEMAWDATRSATELPCEVEEESYVLQLVVSMQISAFEEDHKQARQESIWTVTPEQRTICNSLAQSVRDVLDMSLLIASLGVRKTLNFKAGFDLAQLAFSSEGDTTLAIECLKALSSVTTDDSFAKQLRAAVREIELTGSTDIAFLFDGIAPYGDVTYGFRRGLDMAGNTYISSQNQWLHSDVDGVSKGDYLQRLWEA